MPVPETSASGSYQPTADASSARYEHRHERAYVLYGNPRQAEIAELSEDLAKKLKLEPGKYIVPDLVVLGAVPGANGVKGDADWSIERLLSFDEGGGYHEIAKSMALKGTPLLNPMDSGLVPHQLLPPGVNPGGYLRFTLTRHRGRVGKCHHSAFEVLEDGGIGEQAAIKLHRSHFDAWRIWLVQAGHVAEVNEAAIARERRVLEGRIARVASSPTANETQRETALKPRQDELNKLKEAKPAKRK